MLWKRFYLLHTASCSVDSGKQRIDFLHLLLVRDDGDLDIFALGKEINQMLSEVGRRHAFRVTASQITSHKSERGKNVSDMK